MNTLIDSTTRPMYANGLPFVPSPPLPLLVENLRVVEPRMNQELCYVGLDPIQLGFEQRNLFDFPFYRYDFRLHQMVLWSKK